MCQVPLQIHPYYIYTIPFHFLFPNSILNSVMVKRDTNAVRKKPLDEAVWAESGKCAREVVSNTNPEG